MAHEKDLYLSDLVKSMLEELDSRQDEILQAEYPEDLITELVDSYLPVYFYDALLYACNDLWLATELPESYSIDSAYGMIIGNMAQHLQEKANEWLEKAREVYKDFGGIKSNA